ncbi:Gfo/Idh/MocA family protein [Algibacillus agarilyticus]|uniref:Gfo/Idh/MocA family protein n=1 Tax=Algibacillus agarilyticus TaxID=2234133 RepID=UPI000DCFA232|nr:Gfo/Idh/MocA family oxidoreductase [Algibacillus agarilyticus]
MTIRFAIIGTNFITDQFIDALQQVNGAKLQAVYSRTLETAQAFAQKHNAKQTFTDLKALAQSSDIDAVYIASPNSFHLTHAMTLMNAGKHVLCEKPLAVNSVQLQAMVECAKANNVTFMEALFTTHLPNYQQIKQYLPELGKIHRINASYCQYSSRYDKYLAGENPNTFNPEFANGSLMDLGIYTVFPVLDLFGKPDDIISTGIKLDSGVDGCGEMLLTYKKQALIAHLSHSKINHSVFHNEIQGEKASMVIEHISQLRSVKLHYKDGSEKDISVEQNSNVMFYEVAHFVELILQQKIESPINTWQLSANVMKVLDKARQQQGITYPCDKLISND